jgi:regulator of sigma E protease
MSWLIAAFGIIILVVLHEMGHMFTAKAVGMKVRRFALFFPPYIWRKQIGETEVVCGILPLGGSISILGFTDKEEVDEAEESRTYRSAHPLRQMVVILAGPMVNLIFAFVVIMIYFTLLGPETISRQVAQIAPQSPASQTLEVEDQIVAVNGRQGEATELAQIISEVKCPSLTPGCQGPPLTLSILRDDQERNIQVRPVYDPETERMRVGFSFLIDREPIGVLDALDLSTTQLWTLARETAKIPVKIFTEEREQLGSIVGAYEITRQTTKDSIADGLLILAIISGALCFINLLPLMPLDGSHALVSLIRLVTKKQLSMKVLERWSIIGIICILILFTIGLSNDIGRIVDGTLGDLGRFQE